MQPGSYFAGFDLVTAALYGFWVFFLGLILYLNRESKREGYPLVTPGKPNDRPQGFPGVPTPKIFKLAHGGTVQAPRNDGDPQPPIAAVWADPTPGAPLIPTGNPMIDGVGPAAYALRADVPDLTFDESLPKIVPLRVATDVTIDPEDPDPRGMTVVDADWQPAGVCVDIWYDKSEAIFRFLEVEVATEMGFRRVMIPVPMMTINSARNVIRVRSLLAEHFKTAPTLKNPDTITLLEEDKVAAYCAGGQFYAKRERSEPFI
ncbi:photosynthetic reaction center subunit H [Roseococcus microcysteis]|uniref:photosynthetic reaction center subunit H n=1 Tax=Roseococcus microcysteis TaxID=2771361 RepID=UPI00168AD0E2|nr:photosynthetic reaction center subunit H [Roseococcus microcysteis]